MSCNPVPWRDLLNGQAPALGEDGGTRREAIEMPRRKVQPPPRMVGGQDGAVGDLAPARGATINHGVKLPEGPHRQRVRVGGLGVAPGVVGALHVGAKNGFQPAGRVALAADPLGLELLAHRGLERLEVGALFERAGQGSLDAGDQVELRRACDREGPFLGLVGQRVVLGLGHRQPLPVPLDGGLGCGGRRGHHRTVIFCAVVVVEMIDRA